MKRTRRFTARRKGNVLVLTAFMMVAMMAMLSVTVDIGYLQTARCQLQQSADAAALAAAAELIDDEALTGNPGMSDEIDLARAYAIQFAAANKVCKAQPVVNSNSSNNPAGDVVVGYLSNPSDPNAAMDYTNSDLFNAVQVRVRRTTASNGEVPFFFARALGVNSIGTETDATAALMKNFRGFRSPGNGGKLQLLPFALDHQT